MDYQFYGADTPSLQPINEDYSKVGDQRQLYELLSGLWCAKTCAPRMRGSWSMGNKTLGQCSITAFLVQDIYGGEVYGVPLGDGNFHCFNKVNEVVFDLTSEQFGNRKLDYDQSMIQSRSVHFSKEEKYQRYLLLDKLLRKRIASIKE